MAILTLADINSQLSELKKAASNIAKDNRDWLAELESYLESISTDSPAIPSLLISLVEPLVPPNTGSSDQAQDPSQILRLVLDEINFLQYTDKKLEARVSQAAADSTQESLSNAIKEAEAYLVMTHEAFTLLYNMSTKITDISNLPDMNTKTTAVKDDRTDLTKLVLQNSTSVPPTSVEPEGTDLLLGQKGSDASSELFLSYLQEVTGGTGSKEYRQTQTLLAGGHFTLSSSQVRKLTTAWGKAVASFTSSSTPSPAVDVSLDTIANFLSIHKTLETLYDRLESNVTLADEDALFLLPEA